MILAAGWIAFLIVVYPGQVTKDSVDQLAEARSGFFSDAHPPLMSFLWRYIDKVIPGTMGMLVLQTGLLVAGMFLLVRRVTSDRGAAAITIALLWFPPIAAPMMVIWKDPMMAGLCLLGFGLLLQSTTRARVAGIALMTLGIAFRYNGLALALPLVVLVYELRPGMRARMRYPLAVAVCLAMLLLNLGLNNLITDRKMHFWTSTLAVMDIAGTLCYDPRHYSDSELKALFAGTDLQVHEDIEARMCKLAVRGTHALLTHGPGNLWDMPDNGLTPAPKPRRDAITRVWKDVVPSHLRAYLAYRLSVFYRVLSFRVPPWGMVTAATPRVVINQRDQVEALGLRTEATAVHRRWIAMSTWLAESTPLFRPWLYLALAIVLLALARRRDIVALLLSGIAMEMGLFFVAVSPDYRYSHWLVLTTCIGAAFAIAQRVTRRSTAAADPSPGL